MYVCINICVYVNIYVYIYNTMYNYMILYVYTNNPPCSCTCLWLTAFNKKKNVDKTVLEVFFSIE